MNSIPQNPDEKELRRLLRDAHPPDELPPRFREGVWRRIESARRKGAASPSWIESLAALLFRPAFATAGLAVLMVAGGLLGSLAAAPRVQEAAQARYVAAVSPFHRVPAAP